MSDFEILQKYLKNILNKVNTAICNIASTMGILAAPGQGITINTAINLGDDAAGTAEPGVLNSDRFINQNGFDVQFVGTDDEIQTLLTILPDGSIDFNKLDAVHGSTRIYLTVQPLQQSEGNVPWIHSIFTAANFGDRFNDVHSMGWNLKGSNVKEAGKHAFGWVTEGFFQEDESTLRFEDHTLFFSTDGVPRRAESLVITDGDESEWYKYFTVNDLFGLDPRNNYRSFQFSCTADTNVSELYLWAPESANTKAAQFQWNLTTNRLSISPVGTSNSTFDINGFPYFRSGLIQTTKDAVVDNGLTLNALAGNTSDGWFGRIALTSTDLVLASSTLSLATVAGVAGTHLSPTSITVDSKGRITAIS